MTDESKPKIENLETPGQQAEVLTPEQGEAAQGGRVAKYNDFSFVHHVDKASPVLMQS